MKKILRLLILVVCVGCFASCSDDSDDTTKVTDIKLIINTTSNDSLLWISSNKVTDALFYRHYINNKPFITNGMLSFGVSSLIDATYKIKVLAFDSQTDRPANLISGDSIEIVFCAKKKASEVFGVWGDTVKYTFNADGTGIYNNGTSSVPAKWNTFKVFYKDTLKYITIKKIMPDSTKPINTYRYTISNNILNFNDKNYNKK